MVDGSDGSDRHHDFPTVEKGNSLRKNHHFQGPARVVFESVLFDHIDIFFSGINVDDRSS